MTSLMIRIYKIGEEEPDTTIKVPGKIFKIASAIIPKKVSDALTEKGVDLQEILKLTENPEVKGTLIEIEEHGKNEKVIISLE